MFNFKKFLIIFAVGLVLGGGLVYFLINLANPANWSEGGINRAIKVIDETQNKIIENPQSCPGLPDLSDKASKTVTKVIDGDTLIIEGGYSVRLLGIDADEKNYPCYQAAKDRLEKMVLNQEVVLERGEQNLDQYCRYLRFVIVNQQNVNLQLVQEGLVVARFYSGQNKYRLEIQQAEQTAKLNKVGCKWVK
jgi:endonuclease YncB( thermonuclease family)